jgi:hypothetical protein
MLENLKYAPEAPEPKEPRVKGPSQRNESMDPKWERVKAEIKAQLLPTAVKKKNEK